MIEVEVKFIAPASLTQTMQIARDAGFKSYDNADIADAYYDIGSEKLLRIRQHKGRRTDAMLTYKGEKIVGKSREEMEVAIEHGANTLMGIFEKALALKPSLVIYKTQHLMYNRMSECPDTECEEAEDDRQVTLSIDHVEGLGDFVEIEVISHRFAVLRSQERIEAWARSMFPGVEFINESYYELMRR